MKIDSYVVNSRSERNYFSVESVSVGIVKQTAKPVEAPQQETEKGATLSLSEIASKALEQAKENGQRLANSLCAKQTARTGSVNANLPTSPEDLKIKMLDAIMYALTGKRLRFSKFDPSKAAEVKSPDLSGIVAASRNNRPQQRSMVAMEFEHFQYEQESVSYQTQGLIQTADGRSISVDISMSMSRQFASYTKVEAVFNTMDPLVINYGADAASLTNEKFEFDLDFDGRMDQISFAGEGSGFLALDKNGDGVINDGSELFGPQSGSGFDELRAYDKDNNGWIDENDAIFDKLVVWSKDKDGNDQLFKLKDIDLGAIYLGDIETGFSINDDANKTNGVLRSTSFFLKESGGAGTISHVDLSL